MKFLGCKIYFKKLLEPNRIPGSHWTAWGLNLSSSSETKNEHFETEYEKIAQNENLKLIRSQIDSIFNHLEAYEKQERISKW